MSNLSAGNISLFCIVASFYYRKEQLSVTVGQKVLVLSKITEILLCIWHLQIQKAQSCRLQGTLSSLHCARLSLHHITVYCECNTSGADRVCHKYW